MKSLISIIIATMLLMTMSSMLYAEEPVKSQTIEQSDDLFAGIAGTQLTDAQADTIEGDFFIVPGLICTFFYYLFDN